MSGGKFLVRMPDVSSSEKVIKIKSLLKEDLGFDNVQVENNNSDETTSRQLSHKSSVPCSSEHFSLSDESKEAAVHIAGYIAKNLKKKKMIRKLV